MSDIGVQILFRIHDELMSGYDRLVRNDTRGNFGIYITLDDLQLLFLLRLNIMHQIHGIDIVQAFLVYGLTPFLIGLINIGIF